MRVIPWAGLTKRVPVKGKRDETWPATSTMKGVRGTCAQFSPNALLREPKERNCLGTEGGGQERRVSAGEGHPESQEVLQQSGAPVIRHSSEI